MGFLKGLVAFTLAAAVLVVFIFIGIFAFSVIASIFPILIGLGVLTILAAGIYEWLFKPK